MTYYEWLEVSPNACPEVIKSAYKTLAKKYHPDSYDGDKAYAEEILKKINQAYAVLGDRERREAYNRDIQVVSRPKRPRRSTQETDTTKSRQYQRYYPPNHEAKAEKTPPEANPQKKAPAPGWTQRIRAWKGKIKEPYATILWVIGIIVIILTPLVLD